jgi:hypothetical protein
LAHAPCSGLQSVGRDLTVLETRSLLDKYRQSAIFSICHKIFCASSIERAPCSIKSARARARSSIYKVPIASAKQSPATTRTRKERRMNSLPFFFLFDIIDNSSSD